MGAPSLLAEQASSVLPMLNAFANWFRSHADGVATADNGSAILASVCTLTIDNTGGFVTGGGGFEQVSAASATALADTITFTATSGLNAIAAVVVDISGAPALKAVWGSEAATGSEVTPTDAEITTALGDNLWCRVADVNVEITGATTGTFTVDNTARNSVLLYQGVLTTSDAI